MLMKPKTSYLGLELKSPIIVSSSTLTGNVESIKMKNKTTNGNLKRGVI